MRLFIDVKKETAHLQADKSMTAAALCQDPLTLYNVCTYTFKLLNT